MEIEQPFSARETCAKQLSGLRVQKKKTRIPSQFPLVLWSCFEGKKRNKLKNGPERDIEHKEKVVSEPSGMICVTEKNAHEKLLELPPELPCWHLVQGPLPLGSHQLLADA